METIRPGHAALKMLFPPELELKIARSLDRLERFSAGNLRQISSIRKVGKRGPMLIFGAALKPTEYLPAPDHAGINETRAW